MPMVCLAGAPGLPVAVATSALCMAGETVVAVVVGELRTLTGEPLRDTIWELVEAVAAA
jgi:hypothetical protein